MQLFDPLAALVQQPVQRRRRDENSSDDTTYANEKAGETPASCFAVDDLHRGNVVREEDSWNTAACVQLQLLVVLV